MVARPGIGGVRGRITLVSVAITLVVLGAGAWFLVRRIETRIQDSITTDAVELAESLVRTDGPVDALLLEDSDLMAQVVDGDGEILAATPDLAGMPLMSPGSIGPGTRHISRVDSLYPANVTTSDDLVGEGPYVVVVAKQAAGSQRTAFVAASLLDAGTAVAAARPVVLAGIPVLTAFVAIVIWLSVGRTLRPVERIRLEAESITAQDLDRRLPLPAAHDEIHALAETLNEMLDRLAAAALGQRRFVSDASHELKSPIAALSTIVDVADDADLTDEARTVMTDLRVEIERIERIVRDLLRLARHDEGDLPGHRGFVELGDLLVEEGAAVSRRSDRSIDVTRVDNVKIVGDVDLISQLIRNLTDNAVRHSSSHVWLECSRPDGEAVIVVSDDGDGIAEEDSERVFERFVRLDPDRSRASGGSGLGLSVARAIARSHGGDVRLVESRHGGASFEVRLPVT